jgi:hypothetical protein
MKNNKMRFYTIEDLLVGQTYRSPNSNKSGQIIAAEKRDEVWAGRDEECYLITYSPDGSWLLSQKATIAVKVGA